MWGMVALVLKGVDQAAIVTAIVTIAKILPIVVFIATVIIAFNLTTFQVDFWGSQGLSWVSIKDQVTNTMLVTMWVFIGIEGAITMSAPGQKTH